jgi:hypothetical protein
VRIAGEIHPVARITEVDISMWSGDLAARDRNEEEVLSLDFVALYNADLFMAILETLVEENQGQAAASG